MLSKNFLLKPFYCLNLIAIIKPNKIIDAVIPSGKFQKDNATTIPKPTTVITIVKVPLNPNNKAIVNIMTIPKSWLRGKRGHLSSLKMTKVNQAIQASLGID